MVVVGTRPEVIKMAPVIDRLRQVSADFVVVHSGQHYDYNMSRMMIDDLELPSPDYSFKLPLSSPVELMARIMMSLEEVISKERSRLVLVEGDTNTVLASALAALRMGVRVCHVESGLRSRDWRMTEEHNRIVVDHIADLLFAPTRKPTAISKESTYTAEYI